MPSKYDYAEFLAALWQLAGPTEGMPTSHGILDRALKELVDQPGFPASYRGGLTFSLTSVGLRCFELPNILLAAQEALLTSEPNPTYLTTDVRLDNDSARQIVVGIGMTTREAIELGKLLRSTVDELRTKWALDRDQYAVA